MLGANNKDIPNYLQSLCRKIDPVYQHTDVMVRLLKCFDPAINNLVTQCQPKKSTTLNVVAMITQYAHILGCLVYRRSCMPALLKTFFLISFTFCYVSCMYHYLKAVIFFSSIVFCCVLSYAFSNKPSMVPKIGNRPPEPQFWVNYNFYTSNAFGMAINSCEPSSIFMILIKLKLLQLYNFQDMIYAIAQIRKSCHKTPYFW